MNKMLLLTCNATKDYVTILCNNLEGHFCFSKSVKLDGCEYDINQTNQKETIYRFKSWCRILYETLSVLCHVIDTLLCIAVHPKHFTIVRRGERDIEPIKCMEIIRRPWWSEANGWIWPGHRGYTSTLYEKCHGIFNDHRESGPRFNVSSERWCLLTV